MCANKFWELPLYAVRHGASCRWFGDRTKEFRTLKGGSTGLTRRDDIDRAEVSGVHGERAGRRNRRRGDRNGNMLRELEAILPPGACLNGRLEMLSGDKQWKWRAAENANTQMQNMSFNSCTYL